jgi:uncharacterized protein
LSSQRPSGAAERGMAEDERTSSRTTEKRRATAVSPDARITAIDSLRGIALFGVLMVNLVREFRVSLFAQFVAHDPGSSSDRFLDSFISDAFEMKAFALFSLLFGIGLAVQYERLSSRGRPAYWLLRRLLALLAFGLIHLLFIWNGDILTEYAVAGLLVLPLLRADKTVLVLTALGLFAFYVLMPLFNLPIYWPDAATLSKLVESANYTYANGSLAQVTRFSLGELKVILPLHLFVFPRTLALFLFGAYLWKSSMLRDLRQYWRPLLAFGVFAISAGLSLTLTLDAGTFSGNELLSECLSNLAPGLQALGYASLIGAAAESPHLVGFFKLFAPLGRMAFSNYIIQSLVLAWVFFGYGLGQFAHMTVSAACLLGLAVYVTQMIGSTMWLQRFRFGPLEWLWRTLMYGQAQPMRRLRAG